MAAGINEDLVTFLGVDESDVVKGVRRANKELDSFADKAVKSARRASVGMQNFGRSLTLFVTAPVVALGVAMTKTASDAEETAQKFGVVFASIKTDAIAGTKALAGGFGFANDQAQALVSTSGNLLQSLGFTTEESFELSIAANQLAADLASFTNVEGGAERASIAITKALLGEKEMLKALDISVNENSESFKSLKASIMASRDVTNEQAKALAILESISNKSTNAIGDFQRSINSTANQSKIFAANLRDIRVEMGTKLLPIANVFISWAREAAAQFSTLSEDTKVSIIQVTALAAAIGPVLFIGGKLLALLISIGPALKWVFTLGVAVFKGLAVAVSAPMLAIGALVAVVGVMLNELGLLQPAIDIAKGAWNSFADAIKSVGDFIGQFFDFIKGGTVDLANGQTKALDIIGKGWLAVKAVWLGIRVAFQTMVLGLLKSQEALLKGAEKAFTFFGVDFAADAINGYNQFVTAAANDLADLTQDNINAIGTIADEWSTGADVLQKDAQSILATFEAVANGTKNLIAENTPEFIIAIRDRIAELRAAISGLGGGDAGGLPSGPAPSPESGGDTGAGGGIIGFFDAWNTAMENNQVTLETWAQFAVSTIDTVAQGFTDGFKAILSGEKSFGKSMIGILDTISTQMLDIAFKSIFQRLQWAVVSAKGKAAEEAPSVFLIPLYVGLAVAAMGAVLGGTDFAGAQDSSGGGGGAAAAPPPMASATIVEGADVDDEVSGQGAPREIVVVSEFEEPLIKFIVDATVNQGLGNGTRRLLTT
jgi:hypothetical protein